MKPHEWAIEEIDGGHVGVAECWKCFVCGASGGPAWPRKNAAGEWVTEKKDDWCFYADGSGIRLPLDCDQAKIRIAHHLAGYKKWVFPLANFNRRKAPKGYRRHNMPCGNHVGAFGVQRKYHHHEGVDLYTAEGTPVRAVEAGTVIAVHLFTGSDAGSPWWLDTFCLMVEGPSGVVNYGEITPSVGVTTQVKAGDILGTVKRVLKEDKGRPTSMLHLELYQPGTTEPVEWPVDREKPPEGLWDPTPYLRWAEPRG